MQKFKTLDDEINISKTIDIKCNPEKLEWILFKNIKCGFKRGELVSIIGKPKVGGSRFSVNL